MNRAALALVFLSGCASMSVACPNLDAGDVVVDAELAADLPDLEHEAGPVDAGVDAHDAGVDSGLRGPFVDDVNAACMDAQTARLEAAARLGCAPGTEYEGCRSTMTELPVRDVDACIAARAAATSCDDLEPASCRLFTIDGAP